MLDSEPWFRDANAWARQQFAEAEERIRQQVQLRPRRASLSVAEENERRSHEPWYFPTLIQHWLKNPTNKESYYHLGTIRNTFAYEWGSNFLAIDEVAHTVKVLMDYVLSAEDYLLPGEKYSVNQVIWQIIGQATAEHRYVGTYLDWQLLEERMAVLSKQGDDPEFRLLTNILYLFYFANDEHALDVLTSYLDHPHPRVREVAVEGIMHLIWHLCHYCPEVLPVMLEAERLINPLKKAPETPEQRREIKAYLAQEIRDTRPYFHFYSI